MGAGGQCVSRRQRSTGTQLPLPLPSCLHRGAALQHTWGTLHPGLVYGGAHRARRRLLQAPGHSTAGSCLLQRATAQPPVAPGSALQGHLHHRLQPGGRSHPGATHHFQEPDQVLTAGSNTRCSGAQRGPHAGAAPGQQLTCGLGCCVFTPSTTGQQHSGPQRDTHAGARWSVPKLRLVVCSRHQPHAAPPGTPACSIIFCEAVAIYGVIVAIILQTKVGTGSCAPCRPSCRQLKPAQLLMQQRTAAWGAMPKPPLSMQRRLCVFSCAG